MQTKKKPYILNLSVIAALALIDEAAVADRKSVV